MDILQLSHRHTEYNPEKPDLTGLYDSHHNAVDRAEAVILLLQGQFIGENSGTLEDGVIFSTLEEVRFSLLDMRVLLEHYHDSQRVTQKKP